MFSFTAATLFVPILSAGTCGQSPLSTTPSNGSMELKRMSYSPVIPLLIGELEPVSYIRETDQKADTDTDVRIVGGLYANYVDFPWQVRLSLTTHKLE